MENFINHTKHTDNFRKSFGADPREEPTYLTFSMEFDFQGVFDEAIGMHTSPLFFYDASVADTWGAISYLVAKKLMPEARRLDEFTGILQNITYEHPWFFQSIGGLQSLWLNASGVDNNFRGKDVVLTVETLEGLDLRLAYLANLYSRFAYDTLYKREILPDNMRYFNMRLYLSEFRNLRQFVRLDPDYFSNNVTYLCYDCRFCEFDFGNSSPAKDGLSVHNPEMVTSQFKIKVGHFFEKHSHPWFDNSYSENWNRHVDENPIYRRMDVDPGVLTPGAIYQGVADPGDKPKNPLIYFGNQLSSKEEPENLNAGDFHTVNDPGGPGQRFLGRLERSIRGSQRGFFHTVNQARGGGVLNEISRLGQQALNAIGL